MQRLTKTALIIGTITLLLFVVLAASLFFHSPISEPHPIGGQTLKSRGEKIAEVGSVARANRGKYEIEIVSTSPIDGGVEVFARAWFNNRQIGFGEDGSVDVERFRIINPPTFVADPQGLKTVEYRNENNEVFQTKHFREDPKEALLQTLEQIIAVKQLKHDDKGIVAGKQGHTTTTVYPSSSAEDGRVGYNSNPSWDVVHDATTGTTAATDDTAILIRSENNFNIFRGMFLFDTSSIADTDTISAATMSLYILSASDTEGDANGFIGIVTSNPASDSAVTTADYDAIGDAINNPTEMHTTAARMVVSGASTSAYFNWAFNATGLANISKTGNSKFGAREGHDIVDDAPGVGGVSVSVSASEETGTTQDPMLVVEHSAAGSSSASSPIFFLTDE